MKRCAFVICSPYFLAIFWDIEVWPIGAGISACVRVTCRIYMSVYVHVYDVIRSVCIHWWKRAYMKLKVSLQSLSPHANKRKVIETVHWRKCALTKCLNWFAFNSSKWGGNLSHLPLLEIESNFAFCMCVSTRLGTRFKTSSSQWNGRVTLRSGRHELVTGLHRRCPCRCRPMLLHFTRNERYAIYAHVFCTLQFHHCRGRESIARLPCGLANIALRSLFELNCIELYNRRPCFLLVSGLHILAGNTCITRWNWYRFY